MANKACCNTPPVGKPDNIVDDKVDKVAGLNVYTYGDRYSSRGVVLVYDIFGLYPQTREGAEKIASEMSCLVIIPDFFDGKGADISWAPMDTEEKQKSMMSFLTTKANPPEVLQRLLAVMKESSSVYANVQNWAALGLCWGGKLVALASGEKTPFAVSGQTHPAMLDAADARAMTIPHICLASPDEPAADVTAYAEALGPKSEVETYSTMFHGWMGARANLSDDENCKEFDRGYKQVSTFFDKHLR